MYLVKKLDNIKLWEDWDPTQEPQCDIKPWLAGTPEWLVLTPGGQITKQCALTDKYIYWYITRCEMNSPELNLSRFEYIHKSKMSLIKKREYIYCSTIIDDRLIFKI